MAVVVGLAWVAMPHNAEAQFTRRVFQAAACAGGAYAGVKVARVFAEIDARRMNLSPADARKRERGYQIGLALALCGGGAALADSVHGKLSERGKKRREEELLAAAADANPRTYDDPENPSLHGTVTPGPTFVEGDRECRVVEDYLADATRGESAFIKYCREPSGEWRARTA